MIQYYFMINLAIRWMPSTFIALRWAKKSPVLWVPVAHMFSSDKNGKTPPSKLPKTTTEKIIDSASSNSRANSDPTKRKAVAEADNAQAGKEAKEKGGDVTATIENKGVADSEEKKESVASEAAEKLGQTEKKTGGSVAVQSVQSAGFWTIFQKMSFNEKFSFVGSVFGMLAFIVSVYNSKLTQQQKQLAQQREKRDKKISTEAIEQRLCDKYRSQTLKMPKHFVPGTSIEKQIEVSIKRKPEVEDYVDFLVGVPGTGKTTAIKNIVTKMREDNPNDNEKEDIYYFSLRPEDGGLEDFQKSYDQKVAELFSLYRAISNNREGGKTVRLVIDDINYLERKGKQQEETDMEANIAGILGPRTRIIVVSSSSSYAERVKKRTLGKSSQFYVINTPPSEELEQITHSMFLDLQDRLQASSAKDSVPLERKQEILRKVEKSVFEAGLPLRQLKIWLKRYHQYENLDRQAEQMVEKLKQTSKKQIDDLISQANVQSEFMGKNECLYRLLDGVVNSPHQVDNFSSLRITRQFSAVDKLLSAKVSKLLDELEGNNILTYAKPRYGLYHKILEEIRDEYKLKWDNEQKAKSSQQKPK